MARVLGAQSPGPGEVGGKGLTPGARARPAHLASCAGNRIAERGRRAAGAAAAATGGARTPGARAAR